MIVTKEMLDWAEEQYLSEPAQPQTDDRKATAVAVSQSHMLIPFSMASAVGGVPGVSALGIQIGILIAKKYGTKETTPQ